VSKKDKQGSTACNYFLLSSNNNYLRSRTCVNREIPLKLCLIRKKLQGHLITIYGEHSSGKRKIQIYSILQCLEAQEKNNLKDRNLIDHWNNWCDKGFLWGNFKRRLGI